ncbi:cytidine deaminase-like [Vespa crabro]|uniref:cytidine deaminase-like n=1 Tax=Vespa crabro TaxID=7445 RepID=UPI001F017B2B|nr:cytidine deaminase-like [Vespa crabro]
MNHGDIVDFTSLDSDIQELIKQSAIVREYSYAPYSKFKVGSAILCTDGTIFKGCNVENLSYPVGICAERTAIAKAISEGKRKFKILAVVADQENGGFTTPCGLCRQTIVEFGNITIYCARSDMKDVLRTTINDLLPFAFSPDVKN